MRVRSFIGLLFAVAGVVYAVVLHTNNRELFHERFHLGPEASVPLWGALLAIFLAGFLPTGVTLVVDTLRRDLSQRRDRRRQREGESLEGTLRRAVDFQADAQWGKAAAELETFLAGEPDHFTGQLRYGEVLRHLGRTAEAIEVHRRAAATYPRSVSLLYHLAADYRERGDVEIARETESRIVRDFPGFGLEVLRGRRAAALSAREFVAAATLPLWVPGLRRAQVLSTERGLPSEVHFEFAESLVYTLVYSYSEHEIRWKPKLGKRDAVTGSVRFEPFDNGTRVTYALEHGDARGPTVRELGDAQKLVDAFVAWMRDVR